MLAHLLDASNLQLFSFQCEDEPVKTSKIDGPLSDTIVCELMATQTWELRKAINTFRELDDVHTLDVFSSDDVPERAYRNLEVEVTFFELHRSERNLQEVSPGSLQKSYW
jgi:hypothetical protein